ncbi:MAG TPA: amidohydrolase family protein [Mycobacteriales bacterium]|nr:amidohydrolase family protein [Mycobacteriales bacterium]
MDTDGLVAACGERASVDVPFGAFEVSAGWLGPGIVDEHVHLAFGDPEHVLRHGVVEVCDLGAPPADAVRFRQLDAPHTRVAGPLLTAPGGYPSRSWGSAGFAAFVDEIDQTRRLVSGLVTQVDVVKVALEPHGGSVPTAELVRAIVEAAHAADLPVVAHALSVGMVERALDAGVDRLAHTPTEALPAELIARLVESRTTVVSTLHTFVASGDGQAAVDNAAAIVAAGGGLRYGTDLGNAHTRPGAEPRELALLAHDVGLGAEGALRAATHPLRVGEPAGLVALPADPRDDFEVLRHPVAVVCGATALLQEPPEVG